MRIRQAFLYVVGLAQIASTAETKKYSQSVKLSYEIIGTDKQHPLAEVLYEPSTLKAHLASWTPPSTDDLKSSSPGGTSSRLVRVSLPDGTSTVTGLSSFDPSLSQYIDLLLSSGPNPSLLSAQINPVTPPPVSEEEARQRRKEERLRARGKEVPTSTPKPKSKPKPKKAKKSESGDKKKPDDEIIPGGPIVQVTLRKSSIGPQPQWIARPAPKLDAEGKEIPPEQVQERTFLQKYWWVVMIALVLTMTGGGGDGK